MNKNADLVCNLEILSNNISRHACTYIHYEKDWSAFICILVSMDCILVFVVQVIMLLFLTVSFYCNRFCYMGPFNGSCEIPEQKVDRGVITVSAKQNRQDIKDVDDDAMINSDGKPSKSFINKFCAAPDN